MSLDLIIASERIIEPGDRPRPHSRRWCKWQAHARRWKRAMNKPKEKWGWISMKDAVGPRGIASSPSPY
jgi:hypothetical protein